MKTPPSTAMEIPDPEKSAFEDDKNQNRPPEITKLLPGNAFAPASLAPAGQAATALQIPYSPSTTGTRMASRMP